MNLLFHGIGTQPADPMTVGDALRADPGLRVDVIAANPPFGRKSSMTMVNEAGEAAREDPRSCGTTSGRRPRISS